VVAPISDRLGADALTKGNCKFICPRSAGHISMETHPVASTQDEFFQIARSGLALRSCEREEKLVLGSGTMSGTTHDR
jgi:hypothetical protein